MQCKYRSHGDICPWRKTKLTAASFVGAVGTVSDEVALGVQLGEALATVAGEGAVWTHGCKRTQEKTHFDALWPTQPWLLTCRHGNRLRLILKIGALTLTHHVISNVVEGLPAGTCRGRTRSVTTSLSHRHTHTPALVFTTQQDDGVDGAVFGHLQRFPVQLGAEPHPQQVLDEALRVLLQPGDPERHPEGRQHVAVGVTGRSGRRGCC